VPSRTAAVAAALALAVGAACNKPAAGLGSKATASSTTTTVPAGPNGPPDPITGLPSDSVEVARRPAVIVKVENAPEARPQSGMDQADLVVEERVEGSVVRFLTVFHSHDTSLVGPIRSIRPTDPAVISPIGGVFTFSGGNPTFIARLRGVPVQPVQESGQEQAFILRKDKRRPHATYASTNVLRGYAKPGAKAPAKLFDFLPEGTPFEPTGAVAVTHLSVVFGQLTTATWDWAPTQRLWLRSTNGTAHVMESGARLAVDNVIVQYIAYKNTGVRDVAGFRVDEGMVIGSGEATILSGGRMVKGKWSKPNAAAATEYTDEQGAPIKLTPGKTWVMLPAIGATTTSS
jgi:hypothetical protein